LIKKNWGKKGSKKKKNGPKGVRVGEKKSLLGAKRGPRNLSPGKGSENHIKLKHNGGGQGGEKLNSPKTDNRGGAGKKGRIDGVRDDRRRPQRRKGLKSLKEKKEKRETRPNRGGEKLKTGVRKTSQGERGKYLKRRTTSKRKNQQKRREGEKRGKREVEETRYREIRASI